MIDRFQVPAEHQGSNLRRLGLVLAFSWLIALAEAAIRLHPHLHWVWPSAWAPVFIKTVWIFALPLVLVLSSRWDRLASVQIEMADIVVHRANEQIPLIGRWFSPRRFPRSEWRLASAKRGLFVGKPSSDPSFRWAAERIFLCPEAAKPALQAWLAQLE